MTYVDECLEILNSIEAMSFRFRPKTDEPVKMGVQLAKAFESLSDNDRSQVVLVVQDGLARKLLALSGFMAEAAINNNDISLINSAVVMHVLDDFKIDYRENLRYLVLISYAAKILGVNLCSVIAAISLLASDRARRFLLDFSTRDDDLNKLSSFGIREDTIDGVLRFVPI